MAIYSNKFGKSFPDRKALMRREWRDRQTKPIFSWFGLRDAPYTDNYLKYKGLPTKSEISERNLQFLKFLIIIFVVILMLYIIK